MAGVLVALVLGAAREVWVATEGLSDSEDAACSEGAFTTALRAQRPNVAVHGWHPEYESELPPETALRIRLTRREGAVVLEINGAGRNLARTLPAANGCELELQTAALIVDGTLDELGVSGEALHVDSLAPPVPFRKQIHLTGAVGAGVEQGVFGLVPAFDVQTAARFRYLELTLDVDLGLPSSAGFSLTPPEAAGQGALSATTLAVEVGLGAAPRLGPGRLSADAAVGVGFTFVKASFVATNSAALFQRTPETLEEPFGALRLGYSIDFPWGLFVEGRAEERLARQASFGVAGASIASAGGSGVVTTPAWRFQGLGLLGIHFF